MPSAGYTSFQVGRTAIFILNLFMGVAAASALTLAAAGVSPHRAAVLEALRVTWWAGLGVGLTVAIGATAGRKPVLPVHRCFLVHAGIATGSVLGGLIGSLFPHEVALVDRAFHGLLEHQGIVIGAGVGTILGTAWQIVRVYRLRRAEGKAPAAEPRT